MPNSSLPEAGDQRMKIAETLLERETIKGSWWRLLAGLGPTWRPIASAMRPQNGTSPRGFEPVFHHSVSRSPALRPAGLTDFLIRVRASVKSV
jgi:hypothetical protein